MSTIAFDLDGTLAPVGQPVPPVLADGLRRLEQMGHQVAVSSGKPLAYLCGMLRQLELERPALIGENGAAMQLGIDLPPLVRRVLPYPENAREALIRLRRELDLRFDGQVWYQPNEHMLTCFPHHDALFEPIEQVILQSGAPEAGLVVYRHCDCFDIISEGTDKGAGLLELCRMLDTDPADTIAVGDHDNDLPMFLCSGISIGVGASAPAEAKYHFDNALSAIDFILSL